MGGGLLMMELLACRAVVLDHQHRERHMRTENGHTVETAVEARAGFLDRPVLAILVVSTAVVIVAFALSYLGVVTL